MKKLVAVMDMAMMMYMRVMDMCMRRYAIVSDRFFTVG